MVSEKTVSEISQDEIRKATLTRGTLYRVLSRGFSLEIDEAYLEWMMLLQPTVAQLAAHSESKEFKKGSELLGKFVAEVRSDYEKDKAKFLQGLAAEYASLFLNVGPIPVYLAESVYLGKEHLLYEEPYFDAVRIYQIYGFKKRSSFKEPEDHIAIELEFMAHLCDLTCLSLDQGKADYAAGYLKNQVEFLDMHLSKWVPQLCDKLKTATKNTFYLALANLLAGFLSMDKTTASQFAEELAK